MATSSIASLSLTSPSTLESKITSTATGSAANQAAVDTASDTGASPTSASSTDPADNLAQDLVQLLKALVTGDLSEAKNDLAKFKADLKAQSGETATSHLDTDASSLLKDESSGNTTGEKTDVARIQQDLQAQAASGARTVPASIQTVSPLDALVGKLSASLSTGSTSTALKDLASYLVRNGQGSGSLVNTTA